MSRASKEVSYPGMKGKAMPAGIRQSGLVIERVAGRPDLVHVSVDAALAPPEKAMFVDYVQVGKARDGVRILFGKLHPSRAGVCTGALEVSFPLRQFVNQLHKSVEGARPTGTFHQTVEEVVKKYGYERIASLDPVDIDKASAIRSNFVFMALHEDDAAIDFFHLDASTMQVALQSAASRGTAPATGFKGVIRVIASPTLLLYFLDECLKIAVSLKQENPALDDGLPAFGEEATP